MAGQPAKEGKVFNPMDLSQTTTIHQLLGKLCTVQAAQAVGPGHTVPEVDQEVRVSTRPTRSQMVRSFTSSQKAGLRLTAPPRQGHE